MRVFVTEDAPEVLTFTAGPFLQNTYLVLGRDPTSCLLVDAGAGAGEAVKEAARRGREVEAILLTHAHLDHIDGLAAAKRATDAPVFLHPADRVLFDHAAAQAAMFGVSFEPSAPPDEDLVPGVTLELAGESIEVRFAPGHAPGHVMFIFGDAMALVGDVIFAGSIGRTDLPGGDLRTLMESIRSQVLTLPDSTVLYPGHGPSTNVAHERRTNPFLVPQYGGEFA